MSTPQTRTHYRDRERIRIRRRPRRRPGLRLTSSVWQLAGLMLAFVIVIVPLESGGLLTWARNLPIGTWRDIVLPMATSVHDALQPLGIEPVRTRTLAALERLDTPAAPASAVVAAASAPAVAASSVAVAPPALPGAASAASAASAPAVPGDTAASLSHVVLPTKTPLPPLPPLVSGQQRVVALVGDSMMAVGLSGNLLDGMAAHKTLAPVRAFRSGTGLSRPEVFNWMTQYGLMLGGQQPDVIIVAIGANDGQGFVENGRVMTFGTDDWIHVYETRLRHFVDLLTQHGAQVIWIGLPPMRSAQYNARIDLINRIAYQTVSQNPRALWWSSAAWLGDAAGHYREYAKNEKGAGVTRLRATDGIHMSDEGGSLLAAPLLAWLSPAPEPVQLVSASAVAAKIPAPATRE